MGVTLPHVSINEAYPGITQLRDSEPVGTARFRQLLAGGQIGAALVSADGIEPEAFTVTNAGVHNVFLRTATSLSSSGCLVHIINRVIFY